MKTLKQPLKLPALLSKRDLTEKESEERGLAPHKPLHYEVSSAFFRGSAEM